MPVGTITCGAKVGRTTYDDLHQLLGINFSAPTPRLQVRSVLSTSSSSVRRFSGALGEQFGGALGGWFSSDGGGNCLRRKSDQQSVDSDGMRAGSGNAASSGLQAAPRALLGCEWRRARLSTGVAMPVGTIACVWFSRHRDMMANQGYLRRLV
ncbi:predicted protein [Postia placenta Mad-698-R]|nr:predicted protein [Postia placenta Mad-698-R]